MIAGVLGGVFIAHTLYQIVLSYGASGLEVRFSYAFMSPDPVSLLHYTTHCVVVTALGAELRVFAEHTGRAARWRVRSCGDSAAHSPAAGAGAGGAHQRLATVRS